MVDAMTGSISTHHIKRCLNQLYYTTGIPVCYINADGQQVDSLGHQHSNTPFDAIKHLNTDLVYQEIQHAQIFNETYTHINAFSEHYYIYAFANDHQSMGFIAMGPVFLQDNNQSHELAFMSKHSLSIPQYQAFKVYIASIPEIAPIQSQYLLNMLRLICTYDFEMDSASLLSPPIEHVHHLPVASPERVQHAYGLEKQLSQHLFTDNEQAIREIAEAFSTFPKPILAQNDPLRSEQNLLISTVNTYTRFAIEAGLSAEVAFSYSDYFIQETEKCTGISDVNQLLVQMIRTYKALVKESNQATYSSPVSQAKDYIDKHITDNISLADVADHIGYSSKYLSEVFVKETGVTFKTYVNDKKLEIAKSLLLNPKNTILDICHYLGYCNQSYFSKIFKKNTGTSPSAFIKYHS